jgi:ABC-type glycerol-3-phosphate transport system substrate-binding protein
LAKKFLESIMSQEGQATQIANGELPSISSIPASKYSGLSAVVNELVADAADHGALTGWTSGVPGGLGQQLVDPLVQSMLTGGTTPAAIAGKVQAQLQVTRSGK